MRTRLRGHTFKRVADHGDLLLDLVVFRDLADAAPRPHQRDCGVLRGPETLVDVLLNVEERDDVDPAVGTDERLLERLDAVGVAVVVNCTGSTFVERAGIARGRRDLETESGPRLASRCSGLARIGLIYSSQKTVPDRTGSRCGRVKRCEHTC